MPQNVPTQAEFDALEQRVTAVEGRVTALEAGGPPPVDCVLSEWTGWTPVAGPSGQWTACVGDQQSRVEERFRNVVTPPSGGGAACDPNQHETRTATRQCSVIPPPPNVLVQGDFTYVGRVRLQVSGWNLAGRNEGGQITLYTLSGHSDDGGKLYSFPYNGEAVISDAAPVLPATFITWPTWNNNDPLNVSYVYPGGAVRSGILNHGYNGNPWPFLGLAHHQGLIYVTYLDYYNSDYGATDHCLVVCDITQSGHANSKGPYRFDGVGSVKKIGGGLCPTPQGLGMNASMMCISRNFDNSWGPSLSILDWNAIGSNVGGFNSPKLPVTEKLMSGASDIASRASRHGDYKPNLADQYNPDGPTPIPGYMTGTWTQRDRMNVCAWIETTSGKRGVVFFGGLGTGQIWYGSWDAGPNGKVNNCRSADRGENAEGFRPEWRIYDPLTLNGGLVQPQSVFSPYDIHPEPLMDACERYYTGAYFDQATGLLFAQSGAEVQVWQVA